MVLIIIKMIIKNIKNTFRHPVENSNTEYEDKLLEISSLLQTLGKHFYQLCFKADFIEIELLS